MPTERFELRISYRKLLIGLLITVVPLCLAGLFAITKSDTALQRTIGTHFKILAGNAANEVAQFVHERVVHVGTIATEPRVLEVIAASNRRWQAMSDDAAVELIRRTEENWNSPSGAAEVDRILANPAAERLRRYQELDPRFLRITVTDARGVTVAATHKTQDYLQSDEDYWQAIYADGRGVINLTDILYDDVTKSSYIGVGVPVLDEGNRFVGTVDALVDVSSLFRVVNQQHPPLNLRTTLVKEDGTVICAPEVTLAMKAQSEEYRAVQDALTTLQGRQTGYMVADFGNEARLIGFADTGLKEDYRNLAWIVLVSQDVREALAPVRFVGRLTGFLALLGLALVALAIMYFSLHRREAFEVRRPLDSTP